MLQAVCKALLINQRKLIITFTLTMECLIISITPEDSPFCPSYTNGLFELISIPRKKLRSSPRGTARNKIKYLSTAFPLLMVCFLLVFIFKPPWPKDDCCLHFWLIRVRFSNTLVWSFPCKPCRVTIWNSVYLRCHIKTLFFSFGIS